MVADRLPGLCQTRRHILHNMTSMFSPFGLPEGITLLITDALSSPANFLLHRTLAAYMKKDRKDVKSVVLSVSEDIMRWKALAAKSVIII
jgi:hypothetical protein